MMSPALLEQLARSRDAERRVTPTPASARRRVLQHAGAGLGPRAGSVLRKRFAFVLIDAGVHLLAVGRQG